MDDHNAGSCWQGRAGAAARGSGWPNLEPRHAPTSSCRAWRSVTFRLGLLGLQYILPASAPCSCSRLPQPERSARLCYRLCGPRWSSSSHALGTADAVRPEYFQLAGLFLLRGVHRAGLYGSCWPAAPASARPFPHRARRRPNAPGVAAYAGVVGSRRSKRRPAQSPLERPRLRSHGALYRAAGAAAPNARPRWRSGDLPPYNARARASQVMGRVQLSTRVGAPRCSYPLPLFRGPRLECAEAEPFETASRMQDAGLAELGMPEWLAGSLTEPDSHLRGRGSGSRRGDGRGHRRGPEAERREFGVWARIGRRTDALTRHSAGWSRHANLQDALRAAPDGNSAVTDFAACLVYSE